MILTHLTLENFGIFRGSKTIDLHPRVDIDESAPVILVGGKNGAGKTTILEAIRLCLYGKAALGTRVRKSDYDTYLRERVHRPTDNTLLHEASVQLGFEFVHAGVKSVYEAQRLWRVDGRAVQERVLIYKDGSLFTEVEDSHWDEFLRDLIPPGIANLFFFDGEQIQELADDASETEALETAVNGLLNLNLVDRLKADLDLYVRQQQRQDRTSYEQRADELHDEYVRLQDALSHFKQDRAGLVAKLDNVRKHLESARQELVREGATFLQERNRLEDEAKDLDRQIDRARAAIRDLAGELLPFAIAPEWSCRLRDRLLKEMRLEEDRIAYQIRVSAAADIVNVLLDPGFRERVIPSARAEEWWSLVDRVRHIVRSEESEPGGSVIHELSAQRRHQLLECIQEVLDQLPAQIADLSQQLEVAEERLRKVNQSLRQVPDEAVANPLIEEFQRLSVQVGELTQQIRDKDESIHAAELRCAEVDRQRKTVWAEISKLGDVDLRLQRAAKVQIVLDEYKARITQIKLDELQSRVAEYFNRLCRKQQLVRSVSIDPDRYRVTLFAENGDPLSKTSLSAGERQLYAMALLWALRTVSGRQLPIIVDTPMGRLDTDHRRTLLTEFFPSAAHQLILLTTDTELDGEGYELLEPAVSRAYMLEYDVRTHHTNVHNQYFTKFGVKS